MKKNKERAFWIVNILVPLILGAVIYYFISPEVIFVKRIDDIIGAGVHIKGIEANLWGVKILRNYMLDMMWGYALVFALDLINGNNTAEVRKIFVIAFSFSAVMEILQLTPAVKGTFDVFDIFVEFLAEVVAVFIIKNKS